MNDDDTPQPPTDDADEHAPPPPAPGASRTPQRRDAHKRLAGVAGGLADFFGVEASAVRVAFVILTFFGIGIPVYIVGWLAMPSPSMPASYVERWFAGAPTPAALLAITIGVVVLLAVTEGPGHDDGPGSGLGWGLALLFGGWLLFRADTRAQMTAAGPVTGPPTPGTSTWHGPGGSGSQPAPESTPAPRPRSILGRVAAGVALAFVGIAALLEQLGIVSLAPGQYVALALTVIGIALIVGAWVGRAYALIGVGIVLLPLLFVLSVGAVPVRGGAGEVHYAPTTVDALRESYTLGAGELELDLSGLELDGATKVVRVGVGLGETTVIVPDDVTVAADIQLAAGEVDLFGRRYVGRPSPGPISQTFEATSIGAGRLELDIESGIGHVIIRRDSGES